MESNPSPDIPDPASATPVTPKSVVGGSAEGAPATPRRVRTQVPRLPSTYSKEPRLPGTYAGDGDGDPNWRKGVALLWVCFGFAAVGETVNAIFVLLSGNAAFPGLLDLARVGAVGVCFLTLWAGWNWTRWLLALIEFLGGAYLLMWTIALNTAAQGPAPTGPHAALPTHTILMMPGLFLSLVYLVSAGYLTFSSDVSAFTQHRREEGRGWVIAPLVLIVGAFVTAFCFSRTMYMGWLEADRVSATRFGEESLRAMSEHWDPKAYELRADEDFLPTWKPEERQATFGTLIPIGPLQKVDGAHIGGISTKMEPVRNWFTVQTRYDVSRADFAHGHFAYSVVMRRNVLGPWRLAGMLISEIQMDGETPAAPDAAAVPPMSAVPAVSAPVATPGT